MYDIYILKLFEINICLNSHDISKNTLSNEVTKSFRKHETCVFVGQ